MLIDQMLIYLEKCSPQLRELYDNLIQCCLGLKCDVHKLELMHQHSSRLLLTDVYLCFMYITYRFAKKSFLKAPFLGYKTLVPF